jgi:hypothetical protein
MLCRSAFERALERKLPEILDFSSLSKPTTKGRLEWLIELAGEKNLFRDHGTDLASEAHKFRKFSNHIVHNGKVPSEKETRDHLETLRSLASMIMRKT